MISDRSDVVIRTDDTTDEIKKYRISVEDEGCLKSSLFWNPSLHNFRLRGSGRRGFRLIDTQIPLDLRLAI